MFCKKAFFISSLVFLFLIPSSVRAEDISLDLVFEVPGQAYATEAEGTHIYVGKFGSVDHYGVNDFGGPLLLGSYQANGCSFKALKENSGILFSSQNQYDCGLGFLSLSATNNDLSPLGNKVGLSQTGSVSAIDIVGTYAYLAKSQEGLVVVDISDVDNKAALPPKRWGSGSYTDIEVNDRIAYITDISGVLYIVDVSEPENPQLISSYQYPHPGGSVVSNFLGIDIFDKKAYIAGGSEGMVIVDVSDVQNPVLLRNVQTPGYARDIVVKENHAFIADTNTGVSVVALTDSPHIETTLTNVGRIEKVAIASNTLVATGTNGAYFIQITGFVPQTAPFLDLPWEYEQQGYTFTRAALSMNAFFDHTYPFLSTSVNEPEDHKSDVTTYLGGIEDVAYSSHDGYDYGRKSGARYGEWVLAAGDGCVSYKHTKLGGNTLRIDHGNGFQSRYLHLQSDDLITTDEENCVEINRGDRIGRVGFSGNVIPAGENGAHLHFMVIQDKDEDGDFEDNIPDGLVDPFGWQSESSDPWETYSFTKNSETLSGNKSDYLWFKDIYGFSGLMTNEELGLTLENYSVDFPDDPTRQSTALSATFSPVTSLNSDFYALTPVLEMQLLDENSLPITQLEKPFRMTINKLELDVQNFKNLTIFSSTDGVEWTPEDTYESGNEIYADINHLSSFVVGGQKIDEIAPETNCAADGQEGENMWYRSDVVVTCTVFDAAPSSGIDYTLYKVNDSDWETYSGGVTLSEEGDYTFEFLSADNAQNSELPKLLTLHIDKHAPELVVRTNPDTPGFIFEGRDDHLKTVEDSETTPKIREVQIVDQAGNISKFTLQKYSDENYISIVRSERNGDSNTFVPNFIMQASKNIDENRTILDQVFYKETDGYIKLVYDSSFGTTRVMKRAPYSQWETETKEGKYYFTINTEGGDVFYEYAACE